MSKLIQLIDAITTFGLLSCLVMDSFLILLTHFVVKRNIGPYKWLITGFALSGMFFSAVEHAGTPILHTFNSGCCLFTVKQPFGASLWVMEILLAVFCGSLYQTIATLVVQFIYRYFAVFNSHRLCSFRGAKILIWMCYPLLLGSFGAMAAHFFAFPDEFSDAYMGREIYEFYGVNLTNFANIGAIVFDDTIPSNRTINWKNFYYFLISVSIVSLQYAIILYCGYYMHLEVKSKTTNISSSLRRLHRQFLKALILQIITPSVVMFIPTIFVLFVPFLNVKISFPTCIFVGLFSVYPAVDALILIYVVSEYAVKC